MTAKRLKFVAVAILPFVIVFLVCVVVSLRRCVVASLRRCVVVSLCRCVVVSFCNRVVVSSCRLNFRHRRRRRCKECYLSTCGACCVDAAALGRRDDSATVFER